MQELIKVSTNAEGNQVVSAKELFLHLGYDKSQWARWQTKNIAENNFAIEGSDWVGFDIMSNGNQTKDYAISLDFAKRIAMMAKTEKGEEARQYFLECERRAKNQMSLPSAKQLALMVVQAEEEKERLQEQAKLNAPKVIFADSVAASRTSILVGEMAKILKQNGYDTGQNRFFEFLRDKGYLIKRAGTDFNMPTQYSMQQGLFEIKETAITHSDGHISVNKTPKITGKGQIYFINKFLNKAVA